jgi:hypothetical protein
VNEANQKRVVLISKSLPKMLEELSRIRPENPEDVRLIVDKKGTIAMTTLKESVLNKEANSEEK